MLHNIAGQIPWANGALTTTTNQSTVPMKPRGANWAVQVVLTGSGSVSVTAQVEVSNDGSHWLTAGSALSLTGTDSASQGQAMQGAWKYGRVTLSSIMGTGATATCFLGNE